MVGCGKSVFCNNKKLPKTINKILNIFSILSQTHC